MKRAKSGSSNLTFLSKGIPLLTPLNKFILGLLLDQPHKRVFRTRVAEVEANLLRCSGVGREVNDNLDNLHAPQEVVLEPVALDPPRT